MKDDWSVFTWFWREKPFPFGLSLGVSDAFLGLLSAGDLGPEKHRRTPQMKENELVDKLHIRTSTLMVVETHSRLCYTFSERCHVP